MTPRPRSPRRLAWTCLLAGWGGAAIAAACSGEDAGAPSVADASVEAASVAESGSPLVMDAAPDAGDPGDVMDASDASAPNDADAGPSLAPYRLVGRYDTADAAPPRLGWPGTEVRARFSGDAISVELADTGGSQFDVRIDGALATVLTVKGARKTYPLASGLDGGPHEVALVKRTETTVGVTQLFGFVPESALSGTPPLPDRRIEMVGDSITCGYGVLGGDASCPFSAATEAETLAWGGLAARELGAIHSAVAWSGRGVYENVDGTTTGTMPERYDRALGGDPASIWEHARFEPAAVVVNLGTNDFTGAGGDPGAPYEAAMSSFLVEIRAAHPHAHLVLATSPMLEGTRHTQHLGHLQKVAQARVAAGDSEISVLDLDPQSASDGYGCGRHPSQATQVKMAAKLVSHLRIKLGW